MIKMIKFLSSIVILFPLNALAMPVPLPSITPSAPSSTAKSYILMDFNSGKVIADKKSTAKVEPASLTKIMTGYVVINELKMGNIKLDDMVTISKKAWKTPGSKMFIEIGKKVSVKDLIKGMVIQSGNDASVALAEHIAGSEEVFAELMNSYALRLEMLDTNYVNSTGLPNQNHYTTAADLAKLTRSLIEKFPEKYKWYSQKKFTFNGITQYNRNKLLWQDKSVDGLKTGHTESAGYCLVASAKRNKMRLISIVLGTNSVKERVQESQKILNFGFRFFETHKLYEAQQRLDDARVWEGQKDTVGLSLTEDLYITIPRGQYKKIKIETHIQSNITAKITKGQNLGTLQVFLNNTSLAERPLTALDDIEEGSFIKKIIDQIKQIFHSLLTMLGF
jgi:D-alanyl-D-alanine carboxypeptidase (penicillin-binding protein 5/6)